MGNASQHSAPAMNNPPKSPSHCFKRGHVYYVIFFFVAGFPSPRSLIKASPQAGAARAAATHECSHHHKSTRGGKLKGGSMVP
eukprot:scaffold5771_cov171-Amphora_coffeaeformis.AAC.13